MTKTVIHLNATDGRTCPSTTISTANARSIDSSAEPGEVLIVTQDGHAVARGETLDEALDMFDVNSIVPNGDGPDEELSLDDMSVYVVADDVDDAGTRVRSAKSLGDLRDAVNELVEACSQDSHRFNHRRYSDVVNMSELPVFSDHEPADKDEIWSWDEDYVLVQDGIGDFVLKERNDLDLAA